MCRGAFKKRVSDRGVVLRGHGHLSVSKIASIRNFSSGSIDVCAIVNSLMVENGGLGIRTIGVRANRVLVAKRIGSLI